MKKLGNLRRNFERFCYKHQHKGIPNLMLYITLGSAIVTLLSMVNGGNQLYSLLCFDKASILKGQVWRLVTYVFTQSGSSMLELLFLYFFYMLGRHVEQSMGTFRFNLFYFTGVILMDIFAMIFCPVIPETISSQDQYVYLQSTIPVYLDMAYYLHLSLVLTFATTYPDSRFMLFFIIPIKASVMAIVYLLLTFVSVFNLSYPVFYFPHNLFPLVALGNYLLFTGKDILNLLPLRWRIKKHKPAAPKQPQQERTGSISFGKKVSDAPSYTHRCTVCGRTDVSDPDLEFRYCSRCNGYFCYCQDHINNHSHIE